MSAHPNLTFEVLGTPQRAPSGHRRRCECRGNNVRCDPEGDTHVASRAVSDYTVLQVNRQPGRSGCFCILSMEVQLVCERRYVSVASSYVAKWVQPKCAISCEQYMSAYALAVVQRFGRPTPSRQALLEGFDEADLMAICLMQARSMTRAQTRSSTQAESRIHRALWTFPT